MIFVSGACKSSVSGVYVAGMVTRGEIHRVLRGVSTDLGLFLGLGDSPGVMPGVTPGTTSSVNLGVNPSAIVQSRSVMGTLGE